MSIQSLPPLESLCRYVGLRAQHLALLAEHAEQLLGNPDALGKTFYWYLLKNTETADSLLALPSERLNGLVTSQVRYFGALLRQPLDVAQAERVRALGALHHRLGISMVWMTGAYERYLIHTQERIEDLDLPPPSRRLLEEAVRKRVLVDMMLQLQGYQHGLDSYAEAQQQYLRSMSRLYALSSSVSLAIVHATDRRALFDAICRVCIEEGGFRYAMIGWVDEASELVEPVSAAGADLGDFAGRIHVSLRADTAFGQGPTGRALRSGQIEVVNNVCENSLLEPWRPLLEAQGIGSMLVAPLMLHGRAAASLAVYAHEPDFFDTSKRQLMATLASEIGHALERLDAVERSTRAEQKVAYLTSYDALTGLPNRQLMLDRIDQLLMYVHEGHKVVVLTLVVEGFDEINARIGHARGDMVLCEVARRISRLVQAFGSVGRVGTARFLIASDRSTQLEGVLADLLAVMQVPVHCQGDRIPVRATLGVASGQAGSCDASTLLRRSDLALTRARSTGRDYRYFDEDMDAEIHRRHALRNAFADALGNGEMELFYQPRIHLETQEILGVEALVRWRQEEGHLAPGAFFPAIEATDLMRDLDRWVIRQAIRQAVRWQASGLHLPISINLSAQTLGHPTFVNEVTALLRGTPLAPGMLEFEVLETVSQQQAEAVIDRLEACRRLGIVVALDDFGTGASSLVHLQQLPFDALKIDQRFVQHLLEVPGNEAIIRSMQAFAQHSGRRLVAEGIESRQIWDRLRALGCTEGQGYGISPPLPVDALLQWLKAWPLSARTSGLAEASPAA
ncbi:diguanylate cyclase (GGDEF) domain [Gulbenkiania indica]|uniref:Diguanylate cyclase DosC n=1 Tax=Gulbenkiania indica TaxID=375574 RepID=A0A0K6GVM5_9NEIS|nr:EAL domain-containing protein [Gulbenkiania indica]CUA82797.1 diguanylate cyclase (GGDEF) domain [Gulbenkiania indica]